MTGRRAAPRTAIASLRARLRAARARGRNAVPFGSGIAAALVAVRLYGILNPGPLATHVIEVGALFVALAAVFAGAALLLSRLWRPLP